MHAIGVLNAAWLRLVRTGEIFIQTRENLHMLQKLERHSIWHVLVQTSMNSAQKSLRSFVLSIGLEIKYWE